MSSFKCQNGDKSTAKEYKRAKKLDLYHVYTSVLERPSATVFFYLNLNFAAVFEQQPIKCFT